MKQTVARNVFVIYEIDPIFASLSESAALPGRLLWRRALNKSIQITLNCFTARIRLTIRPPF